MSKSEFEKLKKLRQEQGMNLKDIAKKQDVLSSKKQNIGPDPRLDQVALALQLQAQQQLLPNVTQKPWGHERILAKTNSFVVKEIFVKQGHRLSEQYHKKKTETMLLVSGNCFIELNGRGFNPKKLEPVFIPPKTIHRLAAIGDCLIVEVSSTELDDVVRLEDDYDRGE